VYQEAVCDTVRRQWEERRLILLWLGAVEATHRDPFTMEFLTRALRLGRWSGKMIETARRLEALA
jgi:hypothetical protein